MNPSSDDQNGSGYDATVAHLRRVLGGFTPGYGDVQLSETAYQFTVAASKLSAAALAREVMIVFGAEDRGRGDKVAWRYGFTVDGVPCMLASTKWGLRLHVDAAVGDGDAADQLMRRVLDKLAAAQRVVAKSILAPQLASQIQAGNITIANQYATLRGSYEYFRDGAERAYAGDGRLAGSPGLADLIAGPGAMEGWWNALAMVSAYFSTFEHILIGCLPFTSFDPESEDLARVIGAKWNEKMRRAVDLSEPESARQFSALRDIAVRFRNTYSHGAFGSGGEAAMSVHLPGIGAVPVALDEFGVRPELLFVPAAKADFDGICRVFDACDDWLANGPLADGHRWVVAGLSFRFDKAFRVTASSARARRQFEEFISEATDHVDAIMNMDI